MTKAIYPGSFDPVSNGHIDLIQRAAKIFDEVVVVISHNIMKKTAFSVEERIQMLKDVTADIPNIKVASYDGLVVNYAKEQGIKILIRGLRNYQDYESEFSLYQFNRDINPDIETMLFLPSKKHIFVSSSAIKELVRFGADISPYVPKVVKERIIERFKNL